MAVAVPYHGSVMENTVVRPTLELLEAHISLCVQHTYERVQDVVCVTACARASMRYHHAYVSMESREELTLSKLPVYQVKV